MQLRFGSSELEPPVHQVRGPKPLFT